MTPATARASRGAGSKSRTASPAPATPPDLRRRLRDFSEFVLTLDAHALAAQCMTIHETDHQCARIQSFLRRYRAALKARLVH